MIFKHLRFSIPFTIATFLLPCTGLLRGDDGSMMDHSMAKKSMAQSLNQLRGREFEIRFLKDMIMHHQSAVDMAKLAQKNTKRTELNEMSDNIISAQNKEIAQMKTWLSDWYQEDSSMGTMNGMDHGMGKGSMAKMDASMHKLHKSSDKAFDLLFLREMIKHHQDGVDMSEMVSERAEHSELKDLAANIIKDQSREIQQMKAWQKEW